jgi:hypothetical protein
LALYNKIDQFAADIGLAVHNLSTNQLTFAMTTLANKPISSADLVLGDITQINYNGLSSRNVTTTSFSQSSGLATLIIQDLVISATASIADFGTIVLYNNTASSDPLISWWEFASDITTMESGDTLTVDSDQTAGVMTVE